jgi:hypothetical protein
MAAARGLRWPVAAMRLAAAGATVVHGCGVHERGGSGHASVRAGVCGRTARNARVAQGRDQGEAK